MQTIEAFAQDWLKKYGFERKQIMKNNRRMENVLRRRAFAIEAKKNGFTLNEIKDFLGYSDHTSVLHLINTFKPVL